MSKFDFNADALTHSDGSLDIESSVEKFREALTAWAEETAALRLNVSEAVDALFDSKAIGTRLTAEAIAMSVCVKLGAVEGSALQKTREAIDGYLKSSGKYNSRRGPGGGFAKSV